MPYDKDELNHGYLAVQEADYEWVTQELCKVANKCCGGRVVSVLEGGYRIQGGIVSGFARSVAAHMRALCDPSPEPWDAASTAQEHKYENELWQAAEDKRRAREEAAIAAEQARIEQRRAEAAAGGGAGGGGGGAEAAPMAAAVVAAAASPGSADGGSRKRRRTNVVDYVALSKKMDEEEQKVKGGAKPPTAE